MIENVVVAILGIALMIAGILVGRFYYIPGGFLFLTGMVLLVSSFVIRGER